MRRWWLNVWMVGGLIAACAGAPDGTPVPEPTWDPGPAGPGDAARGADLYQQTLLGEANAPGCITCHSLDPETVLVGPAMPGVTARAATLLASTAYTGTAQTAEEYLRESIMAPEIYLVPNFPAEGMYGHYEHTLKAQEIEDLVAYLLTLP